MAASPACGRCDVRRKQVNAASEAKGGTASQAVADAWAMRRPRYDTVDANNAPGDNPPPFVATRARTARSEQPLVANKPNSSTPVFCVNKLIHKI